MYRYKYTFIHKYTHAYTYVCVCAAWMCVFGCKNRGRKYPSSPLVVFLSKNICLPKQSFGFTWHWIDFK